MRLIAGLHLQRDKTQRKRKKSQGDREVGGPRREEQGGNDRERNRGGEEGERRYV